MYPSIFSFLSHLLFLRQFHQYGNAIQDEVIKFYNLYNPEDNILQFVYPVFEDTALGKDGSQLDIEEIYKITKPPYYDIDIKNE